jgi:GNAT superfamily N-acetyltransferase
VRVAQVGAGSSAFPVVYEELLRPAFPPAELESPDYLRDALLAGRCVISTLVDDEDRPLGAAVGEWDPASRVLLLAYLAVRRACRSQGVGGLLMDEVGGPWQERFRPDLTLAEVEHPLAHAAHEDFGDPAARLAFYHRHGARALDVPYFQPPLTPGGGRVYGLLLVAVRPFPARAASGLLDPGPVRAFLSDYPSAAEGPAGPDDADGAASRMWRAVDRPGGIPLLPLDDPAALPLSVPATRPVV